MDIEKNSGKQWLKALGNEEAAANRIIKCRLFSSGFYGKWKGIMETIGKYYRKTELFGEMLGLIAFSESTRTSYILMIGSIKSWMFIVILLYIEFCKHSHPGIISVLAHQ